MSEVRRTLTPQGRRAEEAGGDAEGVKERRGAENQREILLSAEKAESRRFNVVKVDFNLGVVLKVPRANLNPRRRSGLTFIK